MARGIHGRWRQRHRQEIDAFISYSHKLDGELAKRLQPELERFAKPGTGCAHCTSSATM